MSSVTSRSPELHAATRRPVGEALWDVRLFGAFRILGPDGVDATPNGRKARALLAYLVLADGETVPRDRLCALLWSERGDDQARASLRQTLYEMRALTSGDGAPILLERSGARVACERVTSDRSRMRVAAESAATASLATLLGDRPSDLLVDLDGIDPAFDEWLAAERLRQSGDRRRHALAAAECALVAHDAAGAYRLAQRLLACDPTDEAAARLAMEASHRTRDRDAVRRTFTQLRGALRDDLAAEPSAETVELHRQLMVAEMPARSRGDTGTSRAANDEAAMASSAIAESLAVPHVQDVRRPTLGAALAHHRWHLGGIVALALCLAIVAALALRASRPSSATRTLFVVPMHAAPDDSSAQALRVGVSADLARLIVGNDGALRVVDAPEGAVTATGSPSTFRIDGEARSDAGVLHATMRLSREPDGPIYWSGTFSRPIGEIEALREEMTSKLADVAICALGRTNPRAADFSADELRLLLGACDLKQLPDFPRAAELLDQLVALRPDFAQGWALMAFVKQLAATSTPADSAALHAEAERAAERALALDPNSGDAYYARVLGMSGLATWSERMDLLLRGHALDPMNGRIDNALGWELLGVGRWREGTVYHASAVKADPFSTIKTASLIYALGYGDDPFYANKVLAEARKRFGHHPLITFADFDFNALIGDPRRAQSMLDDPGQGLSYLRTRIELWASIVGARVSPTPENQARVERAMRAEMALPDGDKFLVLETLARQGRVDEAFAMIDRMGPDEREGLAFGNFFNVLMKPLRDDPRFMTVAAGYGLVSLWEKTGHWPDFCEDHALPYDCRVEAERAISTNRRPLVAAR